MNLKLMNIYCTVVNKGVMARAAEELNTTTAVISRSITELELSLNTKLIQRTTRKLSLTVEGQYYYKKCSQILNDVASLHNEFELFSNTIEGKLKLAVPMSFGLTRLTHIINKFIAKYPNVEIEIFLNDSITDLVENGFDLGIRIQRKIKDSSLIGRKFTTFSHHIVGHPKLINKIGKIRSPQDLKKYPCLAYSGTSRSGQWVMSNKSKQTYIHQFTPYISANNSLALLDFCLSEKGLCLLPSFIAEKYINSGRLMDILPQYKKQDAIGWIVYPSKKFQRPAVSAFCDFMCEYFKKEK